MHTLHGKVNDSTWFRNRHFSPFGCCPATATKTGGKGGEAMRNQRIQYFSRIGIDVKYLLKTESTMAPMIIITHCKTSVKMTAVKPPEE